MNAAGHMQGEQQLEQVGERIEQWRKTRTKLGAMPAPLWDEAAAAARKLGLFRVARALGLNYLALKSRAFPSAGVRAQARGGGAPTKPAAFVEMKALPSAMVPASAVAKTSEQIVVEVVAASGARLSIRLSSGAIGQDLAALIASFR